MFLNTRYAKLKEPGYIGSIKTRNRIVKTGASMLYWHEDETKMNNNTLVYYESIAKGGVGLLIVEAPTIDYPVGARWRERYRMDNDKYINGMKELVDVIHKHGCPAFMQMEHDGPWQTPLFPNLPATFKGEPVAASAVNLHSDGDFHRDIPRPLEKKEIRDIVDKFALAAVRAKKAGFEGVDINAASSHLFHNFLSPYWNRRTDEYGGSQRNRAKLITDVVKEIKKRAGNDFAVMVCFNGIEVGQAADIQNSDCLTDELSVETATLLQEAGADALHVRSQWLGFHVGGFLPDQLYFPDFPVPLADAPKIYNRKEHGKGANRDLAKLIKKAVSIPVMTVGRYDAKLGEKILRNGYADFIGMHRRMMADPEYPDKIFTGRGKEAAPCTACGTCLDQLLGMHRRCRINAAMGTGIAGVGTAPEKKRIMVVGAGPGGMEAARVAALRGYDVTIYDKYPRLGGLMLMASVVKGLEIEDLPAIPRYYKAQFKKLGVKVKLGKAIDEKQIREINPDVVILANGGTLDVPQIPGIEKKNVITSIKLHKQLKFYLRFFSPGVLRWITNFYFPAGRRAAIIGSDMHGLEVAEFFIKRNKKVTIVDTEENPGDGMLDYRIGLIFPWLEKMGVKIFNGLRAVSIINKGVLMSKSDGTEETIEADSVIPVAPSKPNNNLYNKIKSTIPEVYLAGDSEKPGLIVDAIHSAWRIAKDI